MQTYLLTWNPKKWHWATFAEDVAKCKRKGFLNDQWSCGTQGAIRPGDRVFLLKQGVKEPKGIFASGYARSVPFTDWHWDPKLAALGKRANYIKLKFDNLLDYDEQIIPRSDLNDPKYLGMYWDTQMSGIGIPDAVAAELEKEWVQLLQTKPAAYEFEPHAIEGVVTETVAYVRGRSDRLRRQALERAKGACEVCGVDFLRVLNGKGIRVLQVHHKKQMSSTDVPTVTKLSDLAVVCANCHLLIHYNPTRAMTISDLRSRLGTATLEPITRAEKKKTHSYMLKD